MFRQGDVLLVPISAGEVPPTAVPAPRDRSGRMILARGEATGHAHVVDGPEVTLLTDRDDIDRMFVRVGPGATVSHEEHRPIAVPPGAYRVLRQREYVPVPRRPVAGR